MAVTQKIRSVLSRRRSSAKDNPFATSSRDSAATVDLRRRRNQLQAVVSELQWDLGGLVYEMAIRDAIRVDVLVRRAAALQHADAELAEVERILRLEQNSTAGECASCGAPHSVGAAYCWQCGQPLLPQVDSHTIGAPAADAAVAREADTIVAPQVTLSPSQE